LLADLLSILLDFHLLSMTCRPWEVSAYHNNISSTP